MAIRYRIQQSPQTVQDCELAAEDRYYEGLELIAAGRFSGGIYLLGYVAEMILKHAYFRFREKRPADLVKPLLGPAKNQARNSSLALLRNVSHELYHSLAFWARLLVAVRQQKGFPLAPDLRNTLLQRSRRMYRNWSVDLRYKRDHPTEREVQTFLDDVSWLRANHVALWRN